MDVTVGSYPYPTSFIREGGGTTLLAINIIQIMNIVNWFEVELVITVIDIRVSPFSPLPFRWRTAACGGVGGGLLRMYEGFKSYTVLTATRL